MAETLSLLKKKMLPWLEASFVKGVFASVIVCLSFLAWRAHYDEETTKGDPVKREAEINDLSQQFRDIEALNLRLSSVKALQKGIWDTKSQADWVKDRMKDAPPVTITYDRKWLDNTQKQLEDQLNTQRFQTELQIIHSPQLSNRDFEIQSASYAKAAESSKLMWSFWDYDAQAIKGGPGLHDCKQEIAQKFNGKASEESARDIAMCVKDTTDWRKWTQYAGTGTVFILGIYGSSLRRKWKAALVEDKEDVAAAHDPSAPVIVSTSQPVTMKPIKIRKAIA